MSTEYASTDDCVCCALYRDSPIAFDADRARRRIAKTTKNGGGKMIDTSKAVKHYYYLTTVCESFNNVILGLACKLDEVNKHIEALQHLHFKTDSTAMADGVVKQWNDAFDARMRRSTIVRLVPDDPPDGDDSDYGAHRTLQRLYAMDESIAAT